LINSLPIPPMEADFLATDARKLYRRAREPIFLLMIIGGEDILVHDHNRGAVARRALARKHEDAALEADVTRMCDFVNVFLSDSFDQKGGLLTQRLLLASGHGYPVHLLFEKSKHRRASVAQMARQVRGARSAIKDRNGVRDSPSQNFLREVRDKQMRLQKLQRRMDEQFGNWHPTHSGAVDI
jgi:hypothetical protein